MTFERGSPKWVSSDAVTLQVRCPAKLNLFLSVGPPEPSGFHPIRTVFQAVGLFDDLHISTEVEKTEVFSDWPGMPSTNTVTRTLSLLRELVDIPPLRIEIVKRIPAQSGLGGGSSNAAGVLRALPKLISTPIAQDSINDVARAVGSDVPFFLLGGRALGEGFGEVLTPLPDSDSWYVIARPEVSCSTTEMYAKLDGLAYESRDFSPDESTYNDFERVAPCECLDLIELMIQSGATDAGLTGSGSAVFGILANEADAILTANAFKEAFNGPCWVVPALSRQASLKVD